MEDDLASGRREAPSGHPPEEALPTALYDSHAHLAELGPVSPWERRRLDAMGGIVGAATSRRDWDALRRWAGLPNVAMALGVHPSGIAEDLDVTGLLSALEEELSSGGRLRAVGEIGLDRADCPVPPEVQLRFFIAQMEFAARHGLPVIVHLRKAWRDLHSVLESHPSFADLRIVYHNASCSLETARRLLRLPRLLFSFSGAVTWPDARRIRRLAAAVPEDRLLVESDTPGLRPCGEDRSRPWTVDRNLDALASLRNQPLRRLAESIARNWRAAFAPPPRSPA